IDKDLPTWTEHNFASFFKLSMLADELTTLTKLGEEKIEGRDALAVRAESDKLGQVDFYFSKETGLLLKSKKLLPGTADNRIAMEAFLNDYKDIQGGMVPMR